jgi:AcrR family transcriptional regulator
MNPSNSREALIAEALGEFHRLLERIDAVQPRLEDTADRIEQTAATLHADVDPFRKQVVEFFYENQKKAAANASRITGEHALKVFVAQTDELKKSAHAIFAEEVTPPLRQLTAELRAAIRQAHRPWDQWLTHAATAAGTAALSAALAVFLLRTNEASPQQPATGEPPACVNSAPAAVPPPERARVRT